jgi:hypothetical protein
MNKKRRKSRLPYLFCPPSADAATLRSKKRSSRGSRKEQQEKILTHLQTY